MAMSKTRPQAKNVSEFIHSFANSPQKIADSLALVQLMEKITKQPATLWGSSIIGCGSYHYKYASGHAGDAPLIGFSPRKTAISLYIFTGLPEHETYLEQLGKFKRGKACIYIQKLSDLHLAALEKLMSVTIRFLKDTYPAG